MNNKLQTLHLVLGLAILTLLGASCENKTQTTNDADNKVATKQVLSNNLSIAYIDTDSLLRKYDLAVNLQEELLKQEEKSRTDFNEQAQNLQKQMAEFQRKVQNNGFLTQDRAKQEQIRLMKKDQELQKLNQKLSQELMQRQDKVNKQLRDTLKNYLQELCADGKYNIILSNTLGDNVLYSEPSFNITKEVTEALNARYAASKK